MSVINCNFIINVIDVRLFLYNILKFIFGFYVEGNKIKVLNK